MCTGPEYGPKGREASSLFRSTVTGQDKKPKHAAPRESAVADARHANADGQIADQIPKVSVQRTLAGGNFDPFNALCVDRPSKSDQLFLDHAVNSQWAAFAPSKTLADMITFKQNVMAYAIHNPASYHAMIYAGACHKSFWQGDSCKTAQRDVQLLQLKLRAIGALRNVTQKPVDYDMQDVMMATLLLATHDRADEARRRPLSKVQARKSFTDNPDSEFYFALDINRHLLSAFHDLLDRNGGIKSVENSPLQILAIL